MMFRLLSAIVSYNGSTHIFAYRSNSAIVIHFGILNDTIITYELTLQQVSLELHP